MKRHPKAKRDPEPVKRSEWTQVLEGTSRSSSGRGMTGWVQRRSNPWRPTPMPPLILLPMGAPILRTKLFAPRPGPAVIPRERLNRRLDEALGRRLVLVSAPAGFGKTTAVARWLDERGQPAAWLSVEEGDQDPIRFWAHVVAALNELPDVSVPESSAIVQASDPDPDGVIHSLCNELASGSAARTLIVLDDLHAISSHEVLSGLERFLDRAPPSLTIVITTRSDPPLALSRYRARGQLIEIRQEDLRFTRDEMVAYLNDTLGFELPDAAVRSLETRTEGWAASLQLAALSLERIERDDRPRFVSRFAGDDRFIMDYLVDEVLSGQDETVKRFLLATSVLDRLSQPLCQAVVRIVGVEEEDAPALADLEASGLFLIPLDSRREWFRYHHLFADLLRVRCRDELDAFALLREASQWCEGEGLFAEAVEYAHRAEDPERAAQILEACFPALLGRGEFSTIREGIGRLSVERVHGSTGLCMAMAYMEHLSANLDAAREWVDRGEALLATKDPTDDRLSSQRAHMALLRGFRMEAEQRVEAAQAEYEDARSRFQDLDVPYLECVAEQGLAGAFMAQEDFRRCEEVGRRAWRHGVETGNLLVSSTAVNRLLLCFEAQGRLDDAEALCAEHLDAVSTRPGGDQILVHGYTHTGMAGLLLDQNRLTEAEKRLSAIEARSRAANSHTLTGTILLLQLRLYLAQGRLDEAGDASDELQALLVGAKMIHLVRRIADCLEVRLDLARGRVARASDWASSVDVDQSFPTLTRLTRARVMDAQGKTREAADLAVGTAATARNRGAWGWALEGHGLEAVFLAKLRDPAALEAAARAAELASQQNRTGSLLDLGEPFAEVLARAQAKGALRAVPEGFVAGLLGAFQERGRNDDQALLSDRELDVLRLLDAGLSNKGGGRAPLRVRRHGEAPHPQHLQEVGDEAPVRGPQEGESSRTSLVSLSQIKASLNQIKVSLNRVKVSLNQGKVSLNQINHRINFR